jgi:hypothetical protein
MKFNKASLLAGLAAAVAAEDLLFVDQFLFQEYTDATGPLGFTAKVVTEIEWAAMTTVDFTKFKAIIMSDPSCGGGTDSIKFLDDSKAVWSPAITGNMILIGNTHNQHCSNHI